MATRYRDRLTGRFVSARKWAANPSKRYGGGKRYVKERYYWHKEREPKPGPRPGPGNVEWLISVDYNQGKRKFRADFVIVAPASATPTELADQARLQLPSGKRFLANWVEGVFANVSMGQPTNRQPSTRLRSFQRRKTT